MRGGSFVPSPFSQFNGYAWWLCMVARPFHCVCLWLLIRSIARPPHPSFFALPLNPNLSPESKSEPVKYVRGMKVRKPGDAGLQGEITGSGILCYCVSCKRVER
ncbi:increased dna methylation 1 [Sesbania bispinosa]|nr:increased dna methylation 1 [Sesbania bispinosa]